MHFLQLLLNKMKVGFLENFSVSNFNVYNVVEKSGSRIEYSLQLDETLIDLGKKITSIPLKYASIVLAKNNPDAKDQDFHIDSSSGERAMIYLTDVENAKNGPIEFQNNQKIIGKAGTYVHYLANELHRGCKSDIDRYALAFAFDKNPNIIIDTVGVVPEVNPPPSNTVLITSVFAIALIFIFMNVNNFK